MKKLLLHIVLISYTALLFKPVMPYADDFISHVFFYAKHMATVHAENGKWHVHVEAAQNTRNDTGNETKLPSSSKNENNITDHCLFLNSHEQLPDKTAAQVHQPLKKGGPVNNDAEKNYPPPRG